MRSLLIVAFLLLQPTNAVRHKDAFMLLKQRWANDVRTKNLDNILNLYTEDASLIELDHSVITGLENIRRYYGTAFATYDSDLHYGRGGWGLSAQTATESGEYTEHRRTLATGMVMDVCGRYVFDYREQPDGTCRLSKQDWSTVTKCSAFKL